MDKNQTRMFCGVEASDKKAHLLGCQLCRDSDSIRIDPEDRYRDMLLERQNNSGVEVSGMTVENGRLIYHLKPEEDP